MLLVKDIIGKWTVVEFATIDHMGVESFRVLDGSPEDKEIINTLGTTGQRECIDYLDTLVSDALEIMSPDDKQQVLNYADKYYGGSN